MELRIEHLTTNRICKTDIMGSIYISKCNNFSCKMNSGINFLAGNIYEGGWSVTDFLSREEKGDVLGTQIYLDNKLYPIEKVRKNVYYVTDNPRNLEKNKLSIKENIQQMFTQNTLKVDYETFVSMLELQEMKSFSQSMKYTGHAFLFYSAILGLASGKTIITFPWITEQELQTQRYRFNLLAQISFKLGCVVIVPVDKNGVRERDNMPLDPSSYNVIEMIGELE